MADSRSAVVVAQCRLAGADALATRGLACLPPALHDDILRYRRPQDRLARIAARLLLRRVLQACGLDAFANLDGWQRDAAGRPSLTGCHAGFSISHSDDWAAVAVGIGHRVGLDVESWRPIDPGVIRRYLTEREAGDIADAADPARAMLGCWTLREAVLKAEGTGLRVGDAAIRAIGDGISPSGRNWWTQARTYDHGCLVLAVDAAPTELVWHDWEPSALIDAASGVEPSQG